MCMYVPVTRVCVCIYAKRCFPITAQKSLVTQDLNSNFSRACEVNVKTARITLKLCVRQFWWN